MPDKMSTAAKIRVYANYGYTYAQIAEALDVSFSEIRKALKENERTEGIMAKKNRVTAITNEEKARIIELYKQGVKVTAIAQKMGRVKSSIYNIVAEWKNCGDSVFSAEAEAKKEEPATAATVTSSEQNNLDNNSADIVPPSEENVKTTDPAELAGLRDFDEILDEFPGAEPEGAITGGSEIPWAVVCACRIRIKEVLPELAKTINSAAAHIEEYAGQIGELFGFIGETPDDSVNALFAELKLKLDECKEMIK